MSMSRAKLVIDSKLSDASFRGFWGSQEPKTPKVFPRFLRNGWTDRAEIFFASTRNESGCVFFFSLKNTVSTGQERQNTEDPPKNLSFFEGVCVLKPAKSHTNVIFQRKKKHPPRFVPSTCKKNFSSIGPAVSEKRGENSDFSRRNIILRKMHYKKTARKILYFRFYTSTIASFMVHYVVLHGESESEVGFN